MSDALHRRSFLDAVAAAMGALAGCATPSGTPEPTTDSPSAPTLAPFPDVTASPATGEAFDTDTDTHTGRITPKGNAPRPRILATTSDFERVAAYRGSDPYVTAWTNSALQSADQLLDAQPWLTFDPGTSRSRVRTLAFAYRMTDDGRYAERAWEELRALAGHDDWNPKKFLRTAGAARTVAVGYDWLYDHLTAEQRATLREALVEKALAVALRVYRDAAPPDVPTHWPRRTNNWNTVCNSGVILGALALYGDPGADEDLLAAVLEEASTSLDRSLRTIGRDGGWREGPAYWDYNNRYLVAYLASALNTLGGAQEHMKTSGLSRTGFYPVYLTGPTGVFNFGDTGGARFGGEAETISIGAPELFWHAATFEHPPLGGFRRDIAGKRAGGVLDALWYRPDAVASVETLPPDAHFRDAGTVSFRSAWNDPGAAAVGVQTGDNRDPHADLDLGSFVYDVAGERWATDLGAASYGVPGYWEDGPNGRRWTYYRKRAEGHNTLVVAPDDGPNQSPLAEASVTSVKTSADAAFTVVDLSEAYASEADSVRRGVALLDDRRHLLVKDRVVLPEPATVWWFQHTRARTDRRNGGRAALLERGGERLWARLSGPSRASFETRTAAPLPTAPDPAAQSIPENVRKLAVEVPDTTALELTVRLSPADGRERPPPRPTAPPIADWSLDTLS